MTIILDLSRRALLRSGAALTVLGSAGPAACSPAPALAASPVAVAIERHRAALAASDALDDAASLKAERTAWFAFLAVPCWDAPDVLAKLGYVLDSERLSDWLEEDAERSWTLLASLRLTYSDARPAEGQHAADAPEAGSVGRVQQDDRAAVPHHYGGDAG